MSDEPPIEFIEDVIIVSADTGTVPIPGAPRPSDTGGDTRWYQATVDETSWDKSFPFQLVLLEKTPGDGYQITPGSGYTLPIPPQALTISTPFAISGSVTLGGYVEEHNGAPIRNIVLQGTTGVVPRKGVAAQAQQFGGSTILGGTVAGALQVQAGVKTALQGITRGTPANLITDITADPNTKNTSGYFQFMLLRNYLEKYTALKMTREGANTRLGLAIWKDREVYLVTPVSFDLQRSAQSPLEYTYSLTMRAFRRINPKTTVVSQAPHKSVVRDPNALAQMLNRVRGVRQALQGVSAMLTGFRADVDATVFQTIRELGLVVKDTLGVGLTMADLPANIAMDAREAILSAASSLDGVSAVGAAFASSGSRFDAINADTAKKLQNLSVITGIAATQARPLGVGQVGLGANEADPANDIFHNPGKHLGFYDSLQVGSLNLKPQTAKKIEAERRRVRGFTRPDYEARRDAVVKLSSDYADAVGAGASTYSTTYARPQPVATRTPTDDDWEVLFALNTMAQELDRMAASTANDDAKKLTAMEYIAGQAGRSGIHFEVPASAFAIPYPYGSTLEMVAAKYLQDPNRWQEIATLNNLRPPYVDEEGFVLAFLANGSGNQFQVSTAANLYIGQPLYLSSTSKNREMRRLTEIRSLSASVHVITVDGDPDLSDFETADAAQAFAFLPGTVNSLQMLYIPSPQQPPTPEFPAKSNPRIDEFDNLLQVGGVDLLLKSSGDLAITADGDCRLSQGMANIIQRVGLALSTPVGTLMHHPEFGLGVEPGASTADLSAEQLLAAAKATFSSDPTFSGIIAAAINKNGNSVSIALNVGIRGYSSLVPISFEVRR